MSALHGVFAQRLEQARFDAFFMADHLAVLNMPVEALKRSHTVIVDKVIPELRRRGLFRREYEGRTLRDQLGLPRPSNRFFERAPPRRSEPLAAAHLE